MFNWLDTSRSWITVVYNLGLMLVLGTILGLLMEKIADLLNREVREVKKSDDKSEHSKRG